MMHPSTDLIDHVIASDPNYSIDDYLKDKSIQYTPAAPETRQLLSEKDARRLYLPVSRMTLHRLIKDKELKPVRIGRRIFFDVDDLKSFIRRNKQK